MSDPVEFYFDFSSPYGYLAAQEIDQICEKHGRAVAWKPILLGAVFPKTGSQPLLGIPLKGDYARIDLPRVARRVGVPFTMPTPFPFMSVAAARGFYWLVDQDIAKAKDFAKAVFHGSFGEGQDMSGAAAVVEVAGGLGIDSAEVGAALQEKRVKDRLRAEVDAAIDKGVFGSPFFLVDGEPFWGSDRLLDVNRWLETGGW